MDLMQTCLIAAGGAVIVGAAAFIGVRRFGKNNGRKKAEGTVPEKAKVDFAAFADTFSGLYEPLYMMGKKSMKFRAGVIGDWVTRTENMAGAENYKEMWSTRLSGYSSWNQEQGLSKVNELLSFVLAAGVCRDTAAQVTVDGTTYKKYNTSDGEMIESGNPAKVKTPHWFIGDKILEKGIIEKI
jgi:hypothetical protein